MTTIKLFPLHLPEAPKAPNLRRLPKKPKEKAKVTDSKSEVVSVPESITYDLPVRSSLPSYAKVDQVKVCPTDLSLPIIQFADNNIVRDSSGLHSACFLPAERQEVRAHRQCSCRGRQGGRSVRQGMSRHPIFAFLFTFTDTPVQMIKTTAVKVSVSQTKKANFVLCDRVCLTIQLSHLHTVP